jgi:predicted transporter
MNISENNISKYGVLFLFLLTVALTVYNYIEGNLSQTGIWGFILVLQMVMYYGVNYEPDWEKMTITEETCPNCKGALYKEIGLMNVYYCNDCDFSGIKDGGWVLHAFAKRFDYVQRRKLQKAIKFWKNKKDLSIEDRLSRYRDNEFLK